MKSLLLIASIFWILSFQSHAQVATQATYLDTIKLELQKEWPANRTINLVFHGHSVPSGYFKTPIVNTLEAYPYQLLRELKDIYPFAVINVIITSIGGENSVSGAERFSKEVLTHRPDVLLIDYALNDRGVGLEKASLAWTHMIETALEQNIKVILLTPSPDQRLSMLDSTSELEQHAAQIRNLSAKYGIGLVDSYARFAEIAARGEAIADYMSQVNHPNQKGHQIITQELLKYFK